jgi:hypothetical protein
MPLPQFAFFHARLKGLEARGAGIVPILSVSLEVQVSTSGGATGQVRLVNQGARSVIFDLLQIEARLAYSTDPRATPSSLPSFAVGRPRSLRTATLELDAKYWVDLDLDFPIPPIVLSELEELRAGQDPHFVVELRFAGVARYQFETPPSPVPFLDPFVTEDVAVVEHGSGGAVLEVERGRWIEKILPNLGFGRWMVYEVPVENFDGSAQVDVYLANSVKQFLAGEYKLSIAASRDVVETLERELEANANPAFGDRFGSAEKKMRKVADSFGELTQAMLSYQAALKSLLAAGAHPERPEELVERPDAEMALWVALSLRRYVGMRLRTTRPPVSESPSNG